MWGKREYKSLHRFLMVILMLLSLFLSSCNHYSKTSIASCYVEGTSLDDPFLLLVNDPEHCSDCDIISALEKSEVFKKIVLADISKETGININKLSVNDFYVKGLTDNLFIKKKNYISPSFFNSPLEISATRQSKLICDSFLIGINSIPIQAFPQDFVIHSGEINIPSIKMTEPFLCDFANDEATKINFAKYIDKTFKIDNLFVRQYITKAIDDSIINQLNEQFHYSYDFLPPCLTENIDIDYSPIYHLTTEQIEKSLYVDNPIKEFFPVYIKNDYFPLVDENKIKILFEDIHFSPGYYDLSRIKFSYSNDIICPVTNSEYSSKIIVKEKIIERIKNESFENEIFNFLKELPISYDDINKNMYIIDYSRIYSINNFKIDDKISFPITVSSNSDYLSNHFINSFTTQIILSIQDERVSLTNDEIVNTLQSTLLSEENIVWISNVVDSKHVTTNELSQCISTNASLLMNINKVLEKYTKTTPTFNKDYEIKFYADEVYSLKPGDYSESDTGAQPKINYIYINSLSNSSILSNSTKDKYIQIKVLVDNTKFDLSELDTSPIGSSDHAIESINSLNPTNVDKSDIYPIISKDSKIFEEISNRIYKNAPSIGINDYNISIDSDGPYNLANPSKITLLIQSSPSSKAIYNKVKLDVFISAKQIIVDISKIDYALPETYQIDVPNIYEVTKDSLVAFCENNVIPSCQDSITKKIQDCTGINDVSKDDYKITCETQQEYYNFSTTKIINCIKVTANNSPRITGSFNLKFSILANFSSDKNLKYNVEIFANSDAQGNGVEFRPKEKTFKVGQVKFHWNLHLSKFTLDFIYNQNKLDELVSSQEKIVPHNIQYWIQAGVIQQKTSIIFEMNNSMSYIDALASSDSVSLGGIKKKYEENNETTHYSISKHLLNTQVGFYSGDHGTGKNHKVATSDAIFDNFSFIPVIQSDGSCILMYQWESLESRNQILWGVRSMSKMYDDNNCVNTTIPPLKPIHESWSTM